MNRFTLRARAAMVLLIVMLMPAVAWAQETLTVYDGTTTNGIVPIYGYWVDNKSKSQFIIPATTLANISNSRISKLTFYKANFLVSFKLPFEMAARPLSTCFGIPTS